MLLGSLNIAEVVKFSVFYSASPQGHSKLSQRIAFFPVAAVYYSHKYH